MKTTLVTFALLIIFTLPGVASADTLTFNAPATAPDAPGNAGSNPGGLNQFDLDHHRAYTWQINNVNVPAGHTITGATLTFRNIRNWDPNPNRLFVHLLDSASSFNSSLTTNGWLVHSATTNGVTYFTDATGSPVPVNQIVDNFDNVTQYTIGNTTGTLYDFNPLVSHTNGVEPGNTALFDRSFTMAAETYVFTFTSAQLQALAQYLANSNNLAFGFDPDCHFWNDGITFSMTTAASPAAVPEPTTLALLGTGLAGLYARRRRQQQQSEA